MIWLLLLGLITYLIVQRVAGITRTPVWLLWLVAMAPALTLAGWSLAFRGQRQIPVEVIIALFVGCLALYLYLIQRGRISSRSAMDTAPRRQPPQPTELIPEIQPEQPVLRPINKAEETSLQTCFPWTVFYLQQIEYRPQAVICRGQLRATPDVAYQTVRDNIEAQFHDRFYIVFQEAPNHQPFFALVPNPQATVEGRPRTRRLTRPGIAWLLAVLTLMTTTLAGLQVSGRIISIEGILEAGLPYAFSVMAFFVIRGFGHYITARRYKIATTLPYFIPVIPFPLFPLGTVGAFIQIRSPMPHRRALFDVAIVGAFLGLCVSIPLLAWGLTQSHIVGLSQRAGIFDFQALNPRFSIVLALFSKLVFGSDLVEQTSIRMHPIAVAGWIGLLFTAFNLMPVGQLDGGRMIHATFGQRTGGMIGQISRFLLLALAVVQPHLLLWAVLLLLLPAMDEPALNDVTEVDSFRDMVALLALTILILIVLPVPKVMMNWLGI